MVKKYRAILLLLPIILVSILYVISLYETGEKGGKTPEDLSQTQVPADVIIDVALYSDNGVWNESVVALERMFLWANTTVELVDSKYINREGLDGFGILCVPGGDMYQYSQDISSAGKEKIRNFVIEGGGYLGICGGAYFASSRVVWRGSELPMKPLGMFRGTAEGPSSEIFPYPKYGMCRVNVLNTTHQITEGYSGYEWILYYWGPVLIPDEDSNVTVLGKYDDIDRPAIITFNYGSGKVFLVGVHPEIEEDSDRDGTDFAEELEDRGSDWDLLLRAVQWLLKR